MQAQKTNFRQRTPKELLSAYLQTHAVWKLPPDPDRLEPWFHSHRGQRYTADLTPRLRFHTLRAAWSKSAELIFISYDCFADALN